MNSEEIKNKIACLKAVEATYDKALKDMLLCILKTDQEDFEFILDSCAASLGMHNTITSVILPFLDRMRIFWTKRPVNPMQDHFISIIRCKLYTGIGGLTNQGIKQKTCMLFLPAGHPHDLELLINHYLFKKAGYKIISLSGNTTPENAGLAARIKRPDLIFTHVPVKCGKMNINEFLQPLIIELPHSIFFVQGDSGGELHKDVKIIQQSTTVKEYTESIVN
jgi:hypothetical protein